MFFQCKSSPTALKHYVNIHWMMSIPENYIQHGKKEPDISENIHPKRIDLY